MYYLNYFFLMSIFGHFIESFFYSSGDSGILLGYWTPIYGIGTVIILLINKWVSKFKTNKWIKILLLFVLSAIILALIESLGGYLIKWIFDKELWDYSNHKFNIGNYTSLEMSLIWGLSSLLLIYFIKTLIDKFINKIPKFLTYILSFLFIIDCIATIFIKVL
ncbi:MAG: putative ABC transporter permease [Bacilli bacterium]|nr:putative ABC transporter permease [Bacilli bacterium]